MIAVHSKNEHCPHYDKLAEKNTEFCQKKNFPGKCKSAQTTKIAKLVTNKKKIFAKENIPIKVCHEFGLNIPDCEDIWVQIELEHGKNCVIGVIYRHPKQNLNRFHLSFEKVLELLSCKNATYYIRGDFSINLLQNESKVKAYIDMTYSLGAIPLLLILLELQIIHHHY